LTTASINTDDATTLNVVCIAKLGIRLPAATLSLDTVSTTSGWRKTGSTHFATHVDSDPRNAIRSGERSTFPSIERTKLDRTPFFTPADSLVALLAVGASTAIDLGTAFSDKRTALKRSGSTRVFGTVDLHALAFATRKWVRAGGGALSGHVRTRTVNTKVSICTWRLAPLQRRDTNPVTTVKALATFRRTFHRTDAAVSNQALARAAPRDTLALRRENRAIPYTTHVRRTLKVGATRALLKTSSQPAEDCRNQSNRHESPISLHFIFLPSPH
jgi:hypothetical protein